MHSSTRARSVALIAILTASSGLMLWLFWRHPLATALVASAVIAALCLLVRLAPLIDFDTDEAALRSHQGSLFPDTKAPEDLPPQIIAG
jgi:Mn2+/Fe2+ NRAMP family transporter